MSELDIARSLLSVLPGSRWIGVHLAQAFVDYYNGVADEDIARVLYQSGSVTLSKARQFVSEMQDSGFLQHIPPRKKLGSAENPITKMFPAAITEQRFLLAIDTLRSKRKTVDYEDARFSGHTLVDFTLKEGQFDLPVNVKNAGTRFENALSLVGIAPDDCVPIPVYKAFDAVEKEPNLLYSISVDYSLVETIHSALIPLFDKDEKATWEILNSRSGTRIRDAEDTFVYGMVVKYWDRLHPHVNNSSFRFISARKAIRILQKHPKRTPGIGLRAWGTGASAEVNVHISLDAETKPWSEIFDRICEGGLASIVDAINRKRTEVVYDPEI